MNKCHHLTLCAGLVVATASCMQLPEFLVPNSPTAQEEAPAAQEQAPETATLLVFKEYDVEAKNVFHASGFAVWDGSNEDGMIWVAHPESAVPEYVVIRTKDDELVIHGTLYGREVADGSFDARTPFLLSAGAAQALGLQPNQRISVTVTAVRREIRDVPQVGD